MAQTNIHVRHDSNSNFSIGPLLLLGHNQHIRILGWCTEDDTERSCTDGTKSKGGTSACAPHKDATSSCVQNDSNSYPGK